jgi:DNA replication initiation complex subunit (GINS family)
MFFYTLKTIFISFLLIALIHYLYAFFKNTLTVPKIKDVVHKPAQRYDEMYDLLSTANRGSGRQQQGQEQGQGQSMEGQEQSMGMGPQSMGPQSMADELNTFLNELKKPDGNTHSKFPVANEIATSAYSAY